MSNKKKIVIVISIISVMILCFSISSFASSYPYGVELHNGDIITFKNIINVPENGTIYNLYFKTSDGTYYNSISYLPQYLYYGKYASSTVNVTAVYNKSNNTWQAHNPPYYSITILEDQTLTDNDFINWLYENTVSGMPDPPNPPHIEPSFWETFSGFFSEALSSGTAIVNWMTITPIALIPLALYCLIVIIAITKRMIKG